MGFPFFSFKGEKFTLGVERRIGGRLVVVRLVVIEVVIGVVIGVVIETF